MNKTMLKQTAAAAVLSALILAGHARAQSASKPVAGPVAVMKSGEIKPGMKGTAWTVFEGPEPELEEILTPLQVDRGQRMEGIEVVEVDENR